MPERNSQMSPLQMKILSVQGALKCRERNKLPQVAIIMEEIHDEGKSMEDEKWDQKDRAAGI